MTNPETDRPAAVPPPMSRAAKAEALLLRFTAEAHRRKWNYDQGLDGDGVPVKSEAFDALHRLGEEMRVALEELRRMPAAVSVPPPAPRADNRAAVLREAADRLDAQTCDCGCRRGAELLRYMADEAAVVPPPALTEEGRLRAHVEVLQQDAERDRGLAKVGARCMREGHQGLIENGRVVIEGWRFALSTALDLGTDAPWEAIHERAKELRRVADEAQPARLDRCPHGCDTSTCPCLACEADDEQPSGGPCVAGEQQNETPETETPRRSRTARFLDALTHSGPGYDLTPTETPEAEAPVVCEGFVWIGQSFATCDRCAQPAWDHEGEEVAAEGAGPFDRYKREHDTSPKEHP